MAQSLRIMDYDFRLLGELPQYVSLQVKRAYWEIGSFKLTLRRGMPCWEKLRRDALLYIPEAPETMLVVEKLTINEDKVVADGTPLKGLCKRRVCVPPSVPAGDDQYQAFGWDRFTGDAESAYLHYAANNITAPEDAKRAFPRMVLAQNQGRGETLPWQARFDRLHELFEDIGAATGVGWDVRPDFANKRYVFGAWVGSDLTAGTRRATLSRALGNVDGTTLTEDAGTAASTVYAGGNGEDENRLILSVGSDAQGLSRRESWTEVSGAEDAETLRQGGLRKVTEPKLTLTATVRDSGMCRYRRDYDVGDVLCVLADGRRMNARLIAMEETWEGGGKKLKATFGDAPVTLVSVLKGERRAAASERGTGGGGTEYAAATASADGLMSAADKTAHDAVVQEALRAADLVNNLTTATAGKALDARQGKALNDAKVNVADIVNNLTSTDTNKPLSAAQGKALQDQRYVDVNYVNTEFTRKATRCVVYQYMYVAQSGSDTTGNGTQANPWATIQHAVDMCPDTGYFAKYVIYVAGNTADTPYNGFTVLCKNMDFRSVDGAAVYISGAISILNGAVVRMYNMTVVVGNADSYAIRVGYMALLLCYAVELTVQSTATPTYSGLIYLDIFAAFCSINGSVTMSSPTSGLIANYGARAFVSSVAGNVTGAALRTAGGEIRYNSAAGLTAGVMYACSQGGRVYSGGQQSVPGY